MQTGVLTILNGTAPLPEQTIQIPTALALIEESLRQNPLVLDDPEPVVAVDTLGAVSVDLICRPWARTDDYWDVYRGVTRDVKERFQAAGLEPPYLGSGLPLVPPMPGGGAAGSSLPIS